MVVDGDRHTGLKLNGTVTAPQGPQTYRFQYQLLGISDFTIDAGGNAVAGGGVVVPRAVIHGADGKDYPASAWQAASGPRLELSFDDSSLPPAAYPYVIDPTTTFYSATSDGYITGQNSTYAPARSTSIGATVSGTITDVGQYFSGGYHVSALMWSLTRRRSALPAR